jgi:hypothetical protein
MTGEYPHRSRAVTFRYTLFTFLAVMSGHRFLPDASGGDLGLQDGWRNQIKVSMWLVWKSVHPVEQAEQDAPRARQAEAAAIVRAEHAQAAAADETARIRADHEHALDRLTTATNARITALEETRDALRVRAERAESDLDAARAENQRLAEQLTQTADAEADTEPAETPAPLPRTASRAKKTSATRAPRPEL